MQDKEELNSKIRQANEMMKKCQADVQELC